MVTSLGCGVWLPGFESCPNHLTYTCLSFPFCKMILMRKVLASWVRMDIQGYVASEVFSVGLGSSKSLINLKLLPLFSFKFKWKLFCLSRRPGLGSQLCC